MTGSCEVWLAQCHLQDKNDKTDYECEVAVWANGRADFEEKVLQHLEGANLKKIWIEQCFPVMEYLRRHGGQEKVGAIARLVNANRLVSLSSLRQSAKIDHNSSQSALHSQNVLPRLREAPSVAPKKTSRYPIISKKFLQDHARKWHLNNPHFAFGILKKVGLIKSGDDQSAAQKYLNEAARIGFSSKKDIVLYTGACLHAKGSLCKLASFRNFVETCYSTDTDIMQRFMDKMTVRYWTYLPEKIKKINEGRPE